MAKQFTKVTKTYATKNKVQLLILNYLNNIDCSLFRNKPDAVEAIKTLYKAALSDYKGKAVIPELKSYIANSNDLIYHVDDVIFISIYNVKNEAL